ncbi:MAG: YdbH domain-containing protein [Nitrospirales bacterium]|nr:YdbH domain-containing protein [Nitrospira sp.]MDR4501448.1 YdbH domain-containing protein [Nitrospirales bacterium]
MQTRRRRLLWLGFASLLLAPMVLYGSFPFIATALLQEELSKNGFKHITIQLGYPRTNTFQVQELAFEKDIAETLYKCTLHDMTFTYRLTELFNGQLQHIAIERGSVTIGRPVAADVSTGQDVTDETSASPEQAPPLTLDELLKPFPILPFSQLRIGEISIHRSSDDSPLQNISLSGTLDHHDGKWQAQIGVDGAEIPSYEFTLSGTSLGDAMVSLHSPTTTPSTLAQFSSQAKPVADNTHIQGTLTANIGNVITLAERFYPIDQELSKLAGTLSLSWTSTIPQTTKLDTFITTVSKTLDGTFQVQATLPQLQGHANNLKVAAQGWFSAAHDRVAWTILENSYASTNIRIDQAMIPEPARSIIPRKDHHLSITFPRPLKGAIEFQKQAPFVTADGLVQSEYRIPDSPVKLRASLTHASGHSFEDLMAEGEFLLSGMLDRQLEPDIPAKRLEWNFSGALAMNNQTMRVSLRPRSFLQASLPPIKEFHIPEATLTFVQPFTISYDLNHQLWNAEPSFLRLTTPQISWQDMTIQVQDTKLTMKQLKGSLSTWETQGQVVLLGIETANKNIVPPKTNWKFAFSAQPRLFQVKFLGQSSDKQLSLYGHINQNMISKEGTLALKLTPVSLSPMGINLKEIINPWPNPVDITSGQLSGESQVTWTVPSDSDSGSSPQLAAKANISIDGLSGHYDNIIFDSLSTNMTLVTADSWAMAQPAPVRLNKLETGVTISNMSMMLDLEAFPGSTLPRVHIRDFSAQLFDGEMGIKEFTFIPSKARHEFTLQAKGLDVGKILKLEQQEGLKGTGLLDGNIPLVLTEEGVEVLDGLLSARPPGGIIQYHTGEGTADVLKNTNENMNLVLQALSNFHYDVLTIGADYDHTGTLLLRTKLQGKNPALYSGKPIHFNLNVEENIPALLKSLQVAKDIEGRIEKLIQRSEQTLIPGLYNSESK